MIGDDLRLKHRQTIDGSEWTCQGRIIKVPDSKFLILKKFFILNFKFSIFLKFFSFKNMTSL